MLINLPYFEISVAIAAAVVLFIHGLKGFSKEVQETGGEQFKSILSHLTRSKATAFLAGAFATAIIQSSSAISSLTVALVESGAITFKNSLPIFLGSNIGSTSTAWLVSWELTGLSSLLIVLSVLVRMFPGKWSLPAKAVFYMGVILLALELISSIVAPLKGDPELQKFLAHAANPYIGFIVGALGAALLQSSSVVVGLAVIAAQQGLLDLSAITPLVIGSNIGTTSTAFIAALSMGKVAKNAAYSNLIFNVLGVLCYLPFMRMIEGLIINTTPSPDTAVALTHLYFNIFVVTMGFIALKPISNYFSKEC